MIVDGANDCSIHVLESRKRFEELRDKKKEQQIRMERVMQESFAQIEASVNRLMQMIQRQYMNYEQDFDKVTCILGEELATQSEIEKKLRMIASIINSVAESSVVASQ